MALTYGTTARRALRYLLGANLVSDIDTGFQSLANDVDALLMVQSFGKSVIATTEARTNTAFGLLTTPDRVQSIVLPTDGLIFVVYDATWQASVASAATAAIFLTATQTQIGHGGGTINKSVTIGSTAAVDTHLFTTAGGLVSGFQPGTPYSGVTTGQILGEDVSPAGSASDGYGGAAAMIDAAAGTYDVSIQFKASSGSVTAKNRKLRVWSLGF